MHPVGTAVPERVNIILPSFGSSFCSKRPGSASLMAMPEPSKKLGGNMRPKRSMSRCASKVSGVTLRSRVHIELCSLRLFVCLWSIWPPAESQGEAATQPEQELCGRLPGHGWQARATAVPGQEGEDRLCRQSHQIWSPLQGGFQPGVFTSMRIYFVLMNDIFPCSANQEGLDPDAEVGVPDRKRKGETGTGERTSDWGAQAANQCGEDLGSVSEVLLCHSRKPFEESRFIHILDIHFKVHVVVCCLFSWLK